uniref:Uncharacterized protein n=1 Tax=Panagrolaimus sp. PS1159 TaxID=55785 RepID=A0AC35G913_9BILA
MYAASYLLSSTGIRYKENGRHQIKWLQNVQPARGGLKPSVIRERANKVLQLVPNRINNLVIVNGNLSDFEMIQACVEVAEEFADNIIVIPPLLARMTYAMESIAKLHDPPADETIMVVTVTHAFVDFVILQRNQDFELNIIHRKMFKQTSDCMKEFPRIYNEFYPHATAILVHDDFLQLAEDIQYKFRPDNCFIRHYKRWDHLLMFGGLAQITDDPNDFDSRYRIPNFSMGLETIIPGRKATGCNYVILPERTRIPCNIYGVEGKPLPITLFYFPEHYLFFDNLTYERKDASTKCVWLTGSLDQIIGFYDERGVPYITSTSDNKEKNVLQPVVPDKINEIKKETLKTSIMEQPNGRTVNPNQPSATAEASQITFVFEEKFCSVEIYQSNSLQKVEDSTGKEWIPLYLSMANGTPEIGEKAKNDYEKLPKYVIYDVLKIVGKPLNAIKIDPKWGFKLEENDGNILFQIETPNGPRLIPQEIVLSAFLKAMKKLVESAMYPSEIKEIRLSTNFKLTEPQKAIFKKAALKINLEIIFYIVTSDL